MTVEQVNVILHKDEILNTINIKAGVYRNEVENWLNQGYDVRKYLHFTDAFQLAEIRKGLEIDLDVSIYAKDCFTSLQMQEIRLGLLLDVDVSIYSSPSFSVEEMAWIRQDLAGGHKLLAKLRSIRYRLRK